MSDNPCLNKCVDQVIASSIAVNGMPYDTEDQKAILDHISKGIEKAKEVAQKEEASREGKSDPYSLETAQKEAQLEEKIAKARGQERAEIIDNGVLCAVSCCCNSHPKPGKDGKELKQGCVEEVLKEADKKMNYKSRYKSEIWWNMNKESKNKPTPFMHRDQNGMNTTEPSHRALSRIDEVENFVSGEGYVRRTDVIMVSDLNKPPGEGNIDKVIEMKFGKDKRDPDQDKAYTDIAGGKRNYKVYRIGGKKQQPTELHCDCENPMLPVK